MADNNEGEVAKAKVGNVSQVYKYFGAKEGEGLRDFTQEWKQLNDEDKVQLTEGIANNSFTY